MMVPLAQWRFCEVWEEDYVFAHTELEVTVDPPLLWVIGDADEFRAGHTNLWRREESSLGHILPSNSCPLAPVILSCSLLTRALYCLGPSALSPCTLEGPSLTLF